ncbi:fibrillin-2-like isoform X2 [Artemia franciscana]|uniref:EGF-like domain-containing protein n=1 Tax=Artemia franciscana TaxID=6661 RepID=A0AA88HEP4_ARTSF|nr:hypothetical protein QYM36_017633 [Artemia franciscana]
MKPSMTLLMIIYWLMNVSSATQSLSHFCNIYGRGECEGKNMVCGNDNRCQCNIGFEPVDVSTCEDFDECDEFNPCIAVGDSKAHCINSVGSYHCVCSSGYTFREGTCERPCAMNPCAGASDLESVCIEHANSYSCKCSAGYKFDGETCLDLNECATGNHNCQADGDLSALCKNIPGSYICMCSEGFVEEEGVCIAVLTDKCESRACSENGDLSARCINETEGYKCLCSNGFHSSNGSCYEMTRSVELNIGDICQYKGEDFCKSYGDGNASCIPLGLKYKCRCSEGYSFTNGVCIPSSNESPQSPSNIPTPSALSLDVEYYAETDSVTEAAQSTTISQPAQCSIAPCSMGGDLSALCIENHLGKICYCSEGFQYDGITCADNNECTLSNPCAAGGDNTAVCVNTVGSYRCQCSAGFFLEDGYCKPKDLCYMNPCAAEGDASAQCFTVGDSRICTCSEGFNFVNGTCSAKNPCSKPVTPCQLGGDTAASCIGAGTDYTCRCSRGFTFQHGSCIDEFECSDPMNPCTIHGDRNATCLNTLGKFVCLCSQGFKSERNSCFDINECLELPCTAHGDKNALCINAYGSYTCACSPGFVLMNGNCLDVDECKLLNDPCSKNGDRLATCINLPGNYSCACGTAYSFVNGTCNEDIVLSSNGLTVTKGDLLRAMKKSIVFGPLLLLLLKKKKVFMLSPLLGLIGLAGKKKDDPFAEPVTSQQVAHLISNAENYYGGEPFEYSYNSRPIGYRRGARKLKMRERVDEDLPEEIAAVFNKASLSQKVRRGYGRALDMEDDIMANELIKLMKLADVRVSGNGPGELRARYLADLVHAVRQIAGKS